MVLKTRKCRRLAATAMEYLVVASFILIAAIYAIGYLGQSAQQKMQADANAIQTATDTSGSSGP